MCKFVIFDIKEFYSSITENLLKRPLNFCRNTYTHQMMIKQLFTTQGNHYSSTISRLGLGDTVSYSMSRWERTMEGRFASYLRIIYLTIHQNYTRKRTWGCIGTREWSFLRIKVEQNQKKSKKSIHSIFREKELKITIYII